MAKPPPSPHKSRSREPREKGERAQLVLLAQQLIEAIEKLYQALPRFPGIARPAAHLHDVVDNSRSAVRFWRTWCTGDLPGLPYITCSFAQAYSAYRTFAERAGELPCTRSSFTHALLVSSEAAGHPVRGKIMRTGRWPAVKSERMLLVTDPPERLQGAWATACSEEFGKALTVYERKVDRPRSHGGAAKRKRGHA